MEWKGRFVTCCIMSLSCIATSIPRRELEDFDLSRIYQHSRPNEFSVSESTEQEGYAWENSGKFEGDMILDRSQRQQIFRNAASGSLLRNGMRNITARWPNNEVIYTIKRGFFSRRLMFLKYRTEEATDFGVSYDIESIMHYSRTAFSANGDNTITPLRPTRARIGQREGMTNRDIIRLNFMYCAMGPPSNKLRDKVLTNKRIKY